MKHEKLRVSKIIDEVMNYLFSMGATDIHIDYKEEEKQHVIHIQSNCVDECSTKINKLLKYLKWERQDEMEEFYWELAGDSDVDSELTLVGMMTDKKEVKIENGIIDITLYRYK